MTEISQEELSWLRFKDLVYKGKTVASLVLSKDYPEMYHLKFYWRDEPTPEFFNIIHARENTRRIVRQHLMQDSQEKLCQPRTAI